MMTLLTGRQQNNVIIREQCHHGRRITPSPAGSQSKWGSKCFILRSKSQSKCFILRRKSVRTINTCWDAPFLGTTTGQLLVYLSYPANVGASSHDLQIPPWSYPLQVWRFIHRGPCAYCRREISNRRKPHVYIALGNHLPPALSKIWSVFWSIVNSI